MRLPPSALGLFAALALAVAPAAAAAQATIGAVRIEGNRRVEVEAIRNVISARPGAPYDAKKLQGDVRALMKLGFFSDVSIEREGPADAPVLVYRVVERPAVREWRVTGNEELSKKDVEETVSLKAGQLFDGAAVQKDVKKIQEKYVEKGYYLAEVTSRVEERPDNQVDVVFVVDEQAKVEVKDVRFVGNANVPADDLQKVMQTRPGGLLSFISDTGTYRQEALDRDVQAVQALYLDRGYVTVKVGTPAVALSPDRRLIYVTIPIEEGERYTIGKIAFDGQLLDQEPTLRRMLKTRSGQIFSRTAVGADLFAIGDVYKDLGYAYANVTPLTATDPVKRILDLTFEVQPGKIVSFERIDIVGNDKTRDKVIRRELRVHEGERFNGTGMRTSRQRVNALGFFETVEITTKPGGADDRVVAVVEVKERPTGTFQVGAGFSSYENFILTGQISQQNFFGWGQTLSLQVQWSQIRQLYQIQFVEPAFLDTRWTFAFDIYRTEGIYTTFTRKSTGGSLTWGYELSGLERWWTFARRLEDMRLFATYTHEQVDVSSRTPATIAGQFSSGTTSSVRLSLQWDKRDNRLFPTRGFFFSTSAEFAPPLLAPSALFGNDVNLFTRYAFDARYYYPIWLGIVARAKLTLGLIRDWDGEHPVPISELFYVGGINSVRGYRFLSISPKLATLANPSAPDSVSQELAVGGDKQAIVNLELEFPVFKEAGIRGVLFADMGNSFARGQYSDPAVSLSVYKAVGFGLRWFSPVGPLRFEWGFPLNRRRDPVTGEYIDQSVDFQFTIGNFF